MSETPGHDRLPLDDYLDGSLSGEQQSIFESQLAVDSALREEVELQRAIEGSLRRSFAPPTPAEATAGILAASASSNGQVVGLGTAASTAAVHAPGMFARLQAIAHTPIKLRHLAAAAAALAVVGSLVWALRPQPPAPAAYSGHHAAKTAVETVPWTLDDLYIGLTEHDLLQTWPCPPDLLADVTRERLGEAVTYTLPPRGTRPRVSVASASYGNVISPMSIGMLVHVEGQPVVVLLDRREHDAGQVLPEGSGLHLHQREVGGLILYEISPRSEAAVLPLFHAAAE